MQVSSTFPSPSRSCLLDFLRQDHFELTPPFDDSLDSRNHSIRCAILHLFTMKFFIALSTVLAAVIPLANAHGYVRKLIVTTDGVKTSYAGNIPEPSTIPTLSSPIRMYTTVSPIKGASNPAMACGQGAGTVLDSLSKSAKTKSNNTLAEVMPGSKVEFDWAGGTNGKYVDSFFCDPYCILTINCSWPHNIGPMLTYMAACPASGCDGFKATEAKWFKISEVGRKTGSAEWVQADVFAGATAKSVIPATLAPGAYLLRHEIIGLHLGEQVGGAEFYASCSHVLVGGKETGKPAASELVSFPGAYTDEDAGIHVNVFGTPEKYVFPGPKIASIAQGAGAETSDEAPSSTATTSGAAAPTGTASAPASSSTKKSSPCNSKSKRAKRNATLRARAIKLLMQEDRTHL